MPRHRVAALLSLLLAIGITLAAILGPLITDTIRFHLPDSLVVQYEGGEVVTLVVVVPLLLLAAVRWLRQDPLAAPLAFGPAAYAVYTFVTAIVGQEYGRYPGNAERAFFLYAALIALGAAVAIIALAELLRYEAPEPPAGLRRATAGVFLLVAAFFALSWTAQAVQIYRGEMIEEYELGPTLFWLVKMLDLGFLVPAMLTIGVGLLRRSALAIRMAYGMVPYAVCMAGAILGMSVAMWLEDDPSASVGMAVFLLPVTLGLAWLAARWLLAYRPVPNRGERLLGHSTLGTGHAG